MKTIQKGAVKFNSIAQMAEKAGVSYMTMYLRLRNGWTPSEAYHTKVRKYVKKQEG